MATISFDIDNAVLPRVITGMLEVYPNTEQMVDPNWVNPGDGSEPPLVPKYTDNQWLKEVVRRFIVQTTRRGEVSIAKKAAGNDIQDTDDSIT